MAVNLLEAFLVKLANHRQADILERHDIGIGRAVDKGMVAVIVDAVDGRGVVGVGAGDDHARHMHDVVLQPRGVETGNHLGGRHQDFLPLMTANLAAGALIFDMDRADVVFDEGLDQVARMVLATVAGVAIGDDQRRAKLDGASLFALQRRHADAPRTLHLVLVQERAHPGAAFFGHPIQCIVGQVGARVFGFGALGRRRPAAEIKYLDSLHDRAHRAGGRIRAIGDLLFFVPEQPLQIIEELERRLFGNRMVGLQIATQGNHLGRSMQTGNMPETRTVKPALGFAQFLGPCDRLDVPA